MTGIDFDVARLRIRQAQDILKEMEKALCAAQTGHVYDHPVNGEISTTEDQIAALKDYYNADRILVEAKAAEIPEWEAE